MSETTYEDVGVERGDEIRFGENRTETVAGKGQIAGQVCFESGISLAPDIVKDALEDGDMEIVDRA